MQEFVVWITRDDDVVNMMLILILNQCIFPRDLSHLPNRVSAIKLRNTKNKDFEKILFFLLLTIWRKSIAVTKSTNQSNFSKINLSILKSSLDEQWALQSITNSGVIEIISSSSLHFAAMYKQPTATHSKNFGRT